MSSSKISISPAKPTNQNEARLTHKKNQREQNINISKRYSSLENMNPEDDFIEADARDSLQNGPILHTMT